MHAQDIWACDFLPVVDLWFRSVYLFFIIDLASRRVIHFAVTRRPTDRWVAQQLREATPFGQAPRLLLRDRDSEYEEAFTQVAVRSGIEVLRTPYRSPTANAICERFLGGVRRECLDHMLILGERQLNQIVKEYVQYFCARPHQGIQQRVPEGAGSIREKARTGRIIALPVLNGLL